MLNLNFGNNETYIETGVVDAALGENKYRVKIGSRFLNVPAAIDSGQLKRGSSVIINRTDIGRYIIGTPKQLKSQELKEVIVDG